MKYINITARMQQLLWGSIFLVQSFLQMVPVQATTPSVGSDSASQLVKTRDFRAGSKANPRREIVVSDLCLNQLLETIQANINSFLKEILIKDETTVKPHDIERKQNLSLAVRFAAEAITLLEDIVYDLNMQCFSYNPEIEYHFIKMCNILKDVEFASIEPYQIRAQLEQVKQFDQYLKLYCLSRKDFLNRPDMDLFNKITKFNEMLMLCLLNEEYFQISFFDRCLDYAVHRPWELMCEYPYQTAAVGVVVAAAVGYFYVYPWLMRYDNNNKDFNVQQDHGLKQANADCGYYGLLHALIRRNAANEEEFNAMVARAKAQDNLLQPWKEAIGLDNWIEQPDIERILRNEALVNRVMQPIVGEGKNVIRDNVVVVARNLADPAARRAAVLEEHARLQRMRRAQGLPVEPPPANDQIEDLVANVLPEGDRNQPFINQLRRNNVPQHVVLRVNRHWITVSVEADPESPHGIRGKIVNSMHANATDYGAVNQLLRSCSID